MGSSDSKRRFSLARCFFSLLCTFTCTKLTHSQKEGDVRLVGNTTVAVSSGLLEVFHNGTWGTVCDDGWTELNSDVVCQQLGYVRANKNTPSIRPSSANRQSWQSRVACNGTESNVSQCNLTEWKNATCGSDQGIAISCKTFEGEVRLVGGANDRQGRLEVFHNGSWGTVCDRYFSGQEANTVCKQLGYRNGATVYRGTFFGEGKGPVWLDDFQCCSGDNELTSCRNLDWGKSDCLHSRDVGVECAYDLHGYVRLRGSSKHSEGRLEVYNTYSFDPICSNAFSDAAAQVVCRQLGFSNPNPTLRDGRYYYKRGYYRPELDLSRCNGDEIHLSNCPGFGSTTECPDHLIVGIDCKSNAAVDGDIRLIGGDKKDGRVEIFRSGAWSPVCDTSFDRNDARVVCRQVYGKYPLYAFAVSTSNTYYDQGIGAALNVDFNCTGNENSLSDCTSRVLSTTDVCPNGHAVVNCVFSDVCRTYGYDRLEGSESIIEGRVEINHNGVLGAVCRNGDLEAAAKLICDNDGLIQAIPKVVDVSKYEPGNGIIWKDSYFDPAPNGSVSVSCDYSDVLAIQCAKQETHATLILALGVTIPLVAFTIFFVLCAIAMRPRRRDLSSAGFRAGSQEVLDTKPED